MSYKVVKYRPEFKSQITQLQTHLWSSDLSANARYFEWKYERNPYMPTPLIYLALYEGQVVGMRGLVAGKWEAGDPPQTFLGFCTCDLAVAPEHRGKGLPAQIASALLEELANRGHAYVFSLSAGPSTITICLATGWRSAGLVQPLRWQPRRGRSFPRAHRYASRLPFFWRYADTLPFLSPSREPQPFYFLDWNRGRRRRRADSRLYIEQTPRPEAMAELVARLGSDGRIRHVRDQEYLAWRYQDPLCAYRFLFWEDGRLEGYLVLEKPALGDTTRTRIVDWEATTPQVWAGLLHAAIRLGRFSELRIWSATLSNAAKALLRDSGFEPFEEKVGTKLFRPCVLARPVRDAMLETEWVLAKRRLLDLSSWDLRPIFAL